MTTSPRTTLHAMDVGGRLPRLRERFVDTGCEALLVTHLTNIRYLTGFSGSAGLLVVLADDAVLVTDGRYRDQAAEQVGHSGAQARVAIGASSPAQRAVVGEVAGAVRTIGLEAEHVSWARERELAEEWFPKAEVVPTEGLVEALRIVKDEGEVARIEAACALADQALATVRPLLDDEPSEADFGLELDTTMRRLGADGPSFETIVASGSNGAKPHARPSDRIIREGDLVVIDFGALVDGYHSDMTRTIAVGEPSSVHVRMLEVVLVAQRAGVDAVAPGVPCAAVDAACRAVIDDAGWGDAFLHGTGHGVGLDIHEAPRVASTSDATLAAGNVVTVEPGVYLPDHGGVRIEDTVVVTPDGCRVLTTTPKLTTV
jgi:Xaa-Pro aminopeptidase